MSRTLASALAVVVPATIAACARQPASGQAAIEVPARDAGNQDDATLVAQLDRALTARITQCWPLGDVRSGSGLAWVGKRLVVAQDDVPAVVFVGPSSFLAKEPQPPQMESLTLLGDGAPLAKADKPDFESVVVHEGVVRVFGSGSTPKRRRVARFTAGATSVDVKDLGALYDALAAQLGRAPNVEGVVLREDDLLLFHRGAAADPSAMLVCPSRALETERADVCSLRRLDLGRTDGVPLEVTDVVSISGRKLLYLAAAEDTPNAIDDGPIVGAAVGVIGPGDAARYAELREPERSRSVRKIEGVALDPGGTTGWVVTDPDDSARPADLCRLVLEGPW